MSPLILDKILDKFDSLVKLSKELGKFDFSKLFAPLLLIVSVIAIIISKLIPSSKWEKLRTIDTHEGAVILSSSGFTVSEVTKNSLTIKRGDEVIKYKGIGSFLKPGQEVKEGEEIGVAKRDRVTVYRQVEEEPVSQRVSEEEITELVTPIVPEITALSDSTISKLQEKYSSGYLKKSASDKKAYKEGCPEHGIFGVPNNFQDNLFVAFDVLMTACSLGPIQAAGIIGCLIAESNLLPVAFNRIGGNYGAQGIAQWRGSRVDTYIKKYGKMPCLDDNFMHQIEFVAWELNNTHKNAKPTSTDTLEESTMKGFVKYEGAHGDANAHFEDRLSRAQYAYTLYKAREASGIETSQERKVYSFTNDMIKQNG